MSNELRRWMRLVENGEDHAHVSVEPEFGNLGYYKIFVDGRPSGNVGVGDGGMSPYVASIVLAGSVRGKGIAQFVYDAIERDIGRRLVPSPVGLSEPAIAFWKKRLRPLSANERSTMYLTSVKLGKAMGLSLTKIVSDNLDRVFTADDMHS